MTDSKRVLTTLAVLVSLGGAVLTLACGEGSGGPPIAPTPSVPPPPRVLQQGKFDLPAPREDSFAFAVVSVAESSTGQWEATVDWADQTNTLWMWVADGICTVEQFALPECPLEPSCPCRFAIRSEVAVPKPRVLTIPNAPGGTRTLIVGNLGPSKDTVDYRMTLTASAGLSSGRPPLAAAGTESSSRVSIGRKITALP